VLNFGGLNDINQITKAFVFDFVPDRSSNLQLYVSINLGVYLTQQPIRQGAVIHKS
jgi:hypothetical protein